jgi:DNA topoisomerase IA
LKRPTFFTFCATVLQLPAQPATAAEADAQKRVTFSPTPDEKKLFDVIARAYLRERLKEAKGIGTPATRAEIIDGLKKQGFL